MARRANGTANARMDEMIDGLVEPAELLVVYASNGLPPPPDVSCAGIAVSAVEEVPEAVGDPEAVIMPVLINTVESVVLDRLDDGRTVLEMSTVVVL